MVSAALAVAAMIATATALPEGLCCEGGRSGQWRNTDSFGSHRNTALLIPNVFSGRRLTGVADVSTRRLPPMASSPSMCAVVHPLQAAVFAIRFIAIAWSLCENRRAIAWRPVLGGVLLQIALVACSFKIPAIRSTFASFNDAMLCRARDARRRVDGFRLSGRRPPRPAELTPGASFVLAQAPSIVLVMSALSALLFHRASCPARPLDVLELLERARSASAARSACRPVANAFIGMVEAPLVVLI